MEYQEDKSMAQSLARLHDLRRNVHDIAERIAEQVSETEEHLQQYVQFELIKAAVCLKNVSEKLATYSEKFSRTARQDHQKSKDALVKRDKVSAASRFPAWAEDSFAQAETAEESSARHFQAEQHKQQQVPVDPDPNSRLPTSNKILSKADESAFEWRGRTVATEASNSSNVGGKPLPSKYTENTQPPRRYFHWKRQAQSIPSHVSSEETPAAGQSSPFENGIRETDKGLPRQYSKETQEWVREQRNRLLPDTREETKAKGHSPPPERGYSDTCEAWPRYGAVERQEQTCKQSGRMPCTSPEEVHAGRPCSHSEYRLPAIGTILPHYDSAQTRNMKKRQDHDMRALFGL